LPLVLKKVSEEKIRLLKSEAAKRGITLSQAIEEAIEIWVRLSKSSVTEDNVIDDAVWEERKKELIEKYKGKYVVIVYGKIQGIFNSIDDVSEFLKSLRPKLKRAIVVHIGIDEEGWEGEWWGGALEYTK